MDKITQEAFFCQQKNLRVLQANGREACVSEPFPKKRTRKFEEKQNESLSFREMLVQAARCVRRLASNCAGDCHPTAECGRTEL